LVQGTRRRFSVGGFFSGALVIALAVTVALLYVQQVVARVLCGVSGNGMQLKKKRLTISNEAHQ